MFPPIFQGSWSGECWQKVVARGPLPAPQEQRGERHQPNHPRRGDEGNLPAPQEQRREHHQPNHPRRGDEGNRP